MSVNSLALQLEYPSNVRLETKLAVPWDLRLGISVETPLVTFSGLTSELLWVTVSVC